jgi:hypothetical protein
VSRAEGIFQRLNQLGVSDQNIMELKLHMAVHRSIIICMTVNDIILNYKSTQENEDEVCELLSELMKFHFK